MTAVRALAWAPRAKQDLRDIWRYYARVASRDVADLLVREITSAAEKLRCDPIPGRLRDE